MKKKKEKKMTTLFVAMFDVSCNELPITSNVPEDFTPPFKST